MTVLQRSGPNTASPPTTDPASSGDRDFISTASSALKRLHFKSAGASRISRKTTQQVPKVVIMGSSTTSNSSKDTINTSTDSANTVATMVTVTDDDADAEASIPVVKDILCQSLSLEKEEEIFSESSGTDDSHPVPPPTTPMAGAIYKEPTFVFIRTGAETDEDEEIIIDQDQVFSGIKQGIEDKTSNKMLDEISIHRSHSQRRHRNHSSKRRKHKHQYSLTRSTSSCSSMGSKVSIVTQPRDDKVDYAPACTSYASTSKAVDVQVDILPTSSSSYASDSKTPAVLVDYAPSSSHTLPCVLPVDIQAENARSPRSSRGGSFRKDRSKFHDEEKKGTVAIPSGSSIQLRRSVGPSNSLINTTTNPLVTTMPVRTHQHEVQQSMVVQQQRPGGIPTVATVLVKNPIIERSKLRTEENVKQLLDVANTLTMQEFHDFQMKYGSPHHSRSQSVKTPGTRSGSGRPNYLCLPQQRSRVASMPNTGIEEEYYRLRHFSITGKGVVNRGDSIKSRRSHSNTSVASSNSSHSTEHVTAVGAAGNSHPCSAKTSATPSLASSRDSSTSNPGPVPYNVLMLGGTGVGKSSLINQFMTSEYLHAYDTSLDEGGEKTVSVLLDGEESELTFIDHSYDNMSAENIIEAYESHAYCVVYSIADRQSMFIAEESLQQLWKTDKVSTKAVILVGNKTDLVRSRVCATEEGKNMATSYDCKFIETSVGINHNVDELLVGILTQIRLKLANPEQARALFHKRSCSRKKKPNKTLAVPGQKRLRNTRTSASLRIKRFFDKVWSRDNKSKSCENLHIF